MNILGPVLFSLIAAVGNAIFAAGQKKAVVFDNPFSFIVLTVSVCIVLTAILAPFFGQPNYSEQIRQNGAWIALSGVGLCITYIGFNLLYSHYGASNYIIYAVLSIITTSIILGFWLFKETFNIYHWLAFLLSIVTIVLFTIGNSIDQA